MLEALTSTCIGRPWFSRLEMALPRRSFVMVSSHQLRCSELHTSLCGEFSRLLIVAIAQRSGKFKATRKMASQKEQQMQRKSVVMALALVALFAVAGCSGQPLSTREKGTLGGAGIGAVGGAIVGAAVGAPAAGAAIGGALGGVTGYAIGNHMQNTQVANQQTEQHIESQHREIEKQHREIQQLQNEDETSSAK